MFRPVVAIITFYHSTPLRLFYTIRVTECLMRRSQHQNPRWSILGVWVDHVIIYNKYNPVLSKTKTETGYMKDPSWGSSL